MRAKFEKFSLKMQTWWKQYNAVQQILLVSTIVMVVSSIAVAFFLAEAQYLLISLMGLMPLLLLVMTEDEKKIERERVEYKCKVREEATKFVADNQSVIWKVVRIIADESFKEILFDRMSGETKRWRVYTNNPHFALLAVSDQVIFSLRNEEEIHNPYTDMTHHLIPTITSPVKTGV